jgi:hypothetical protein
MLVPVLYTAPAHAATLPETWVSNAGSDGAACTMAAPCASFSVALSKTSAGGIINCLTPGNFQAATPGTLAIAQAVTIDCHDNYAQLLTPIGAPAISISATTNAVTLRNINIDGQSGGASNAIVINTAGTVNIEDVTIENFSGPGILDNRSSGNTLLFVKNTNLRNNGSGVYLAGSGTTAELDNVRSVGNTVYGVFVAAAPNNVIVSKSVLSGNVVAGLYASASATVLVDDTEIVGNGTGINSGAAGSAIIANSDIYFNGTGITGTVFSYSTTRIYGNTSAGSTPLVGPATSEHGQQ